MESVKGNEQHHSSERVEKSAQKKLKTSLTESALLEMDGNATNKELPDKGTRKIFWLNETNTPSSSVFFDDVILKMPTADGSLPAFPSL
jgi:hypothetical protein